MRRVREKCVKCVCVSVEVNVYQEGAFVSTLDNRQTEDQIVGKAQRQVDGNL
jgi:hypothetical protein